MRYFSEKGLMGYKLVAKNHVGETLSFRGNMGGKFFDVKATDAGVQITNKKDKTSDIYKYVDHNKKDESFVAAKTGGHVVFDTKLGRAIETKSLIGTNLLISTTGEIYVHKNGVVSERPLNQTACLNENGSAIYVAGHIFTKGKDGKLNLMNEYKQEVVLEGISNDPNAKVERVSENKGESDFYRIKDAEKTTIFNLYEGGVVFEAPASMDVGVSAKDNDSYHVTCYNPEIDATDVMIRKLGEYITVTVHGKVKNLLDDGNGKGQVVSFGANGEKFIENIELPVTEVLYEKVEELIAEAKEAEQTEQTKTPEEKQLEQGAKFAKEMAERDAIESSMYNNQ